MSILDLSEQFAGAPLPRDDYEDKTEGSSEEELTAHSEPLLNFNCWYRDPRELTDLATVIITSSSACTAVVSNYEALPKQFVESFYLQIPDESNAYSLIVEIKTASKSKELESAVDPLYETLKSLGETWRDCLSENWDSYGAQPISRDTYREAVKLLTLIPTSVPMPEIVPEPTGAIALEWYRDKGLVFVVSVVGQNIITYAGLFGKNNKSHGTESFFEELPETILDNIHRVFD